MSLIDGELIHKLYEAPEVERGWERFLEALSADLGNATTMLMSYDRWQRGSDLNCVVGISADGYQAYANHYAALNPWMREDKENLFLDGQVHFGEELLSLEEMRKTEFYHDFGRRHGIVHSMGLVFQQPGSAVIPVLGANRGEAQGIFEARDLQLMGAIAPHVARVLDWQYRQERYQSLEALFDDLPDATWELDAKGVVVRANRRAMEEIRAGVCFRVRQRVLQVVSRGYMFPVVQLEASGQDGLVLDAGYLSVRRRIGKGYVIIYKLANRLGVDRLAAIGQSYGLTQAELRLLAVLAEGTGLKEASERLGISVNTAKSQLAGLFGKTGTRRQAELVRLVTGLS